MAAACAQEEFTEDDLEVAAILRDLPAVMRARCRLPDIPSWGRRRPRTLPVEKPAAVADRGEGAASPDTPLAFPEESREEAAAAAAAKKARTLHAEWVQEQRRVVASLSQENAHLSVQIEECRARLQSSRSTNDSLKQMQSKLRQRQQEEEERKLRAAPGLRLDLNEEANAKAQAARRRRREIRRAKAASRTRRVG